MSATNDRRKALRYDTALEVKIRFLPDGTPILGAGVEIGPNGMRLITSIPLVEASYLHISFADASNHTYCEGRVVWTQRSKDESKFESGIDIQRWGGDVPTPTSDESLPNTKLKKDRRRTAR